MGSNMPPGTGRGSNQYTRQTTTRAAGTRLSTKELVDAVNQLPLRDRLTVLNEVRTDGLGDFVRYVDDVDTRVAERILDTDDNIDWDRDLAEFSLTPDEEQVFVRYITDRADEAYDPTGAFEGHKARDIIEDAVSVTAEQAARRIHPSH